MLRMALFGKREEQPAGQQPAAPSGPPVQEVLTMKGQGLTNNQVIQNLQREGYKSHQIFDAMNQADLYLVQSTSQSGGQPAQEPMPSVSEPEMSPYYEKGAQPWPESSPGFEQPRPPQVGAEETMFPSQQRPAEPQSPFDEGQAFGLSSSGSFGGGAPAAEEVLAGGGGDGELDRIEEVVEAIIDEKWSELMKHIQKVLEWKERVDSRIVEMENKFKNLEVQFDKLNENIIGKISEYDQNIRDVGSEIKGMEKVFQKIIPELTTNVSELSKLTDTMKEEKRKKTK